MAASAKAVPRRFKLGIQLFFALTLATILVATAAGVIFHFFERQYLGSYITAEKEKSFGLLVSGLLDDIISEDVPGIETTMRQMIQRDSELAYAKITAETGNVLFEWRNPQPTHHGHFLPFMPHSNRALSIANKIEFSGETFGDLVVQWDISTAEEEITLHTFLVVLGVGVFYGVRQQV